ncbi:transposase [Escherichia coli]|uniref:transposase n=1 Tax=Escherichia coli TaxID=562 RepID=UPI0013AFEE39
MDATIIEAPSSTKNKRAATRIRRCIRPRKAISGTLALKAHIGVDAKSGLTHSLVHHPAANEHDHQSVWVILPSWRRSNLSQPMPATKERPQARGGWPRWDVDLADRPSVPGR